jgi:hypothetical protein
VSRFGFIRAFNSLGSLYFRPQRLPETQYLHESSTVVLGTPEMLKKIALAATLALGSLLIAGPVWADGVPVAIVNASFESLSNAPTLTCPNVTNCFYNNGPIPGWTGTLQTGSFHPGALFSSIPDGSFVAYTNSGTISQTLASSVLADTLYTLTVFVGDRTDMINGPYTLYLDTILNGVTTNLCTISGNASKITPGTFQAETCSYQSTANVPAGNFFLDFANGGGQLDVDDVSLTATSSNTNVPEPGSVVFLGLGLMLVLGAGIWSKQKGLSVNA